MSGPYDNNAEELRLPRNVEAEAALLGALLIENKIVDALPPALSPEHFFEPLHGRLFETTLRLINEGKAVTPVTLNPLFAADETLVELGGSGYLMRLTADGSGLIGARDFAQQIYDLAILRRIVEIGQELVSSAVDTSNDLEPAKRLQEAQEALYRIGAGSNDGFETMTAAEAARKAYEQADEEADSGKHRILLPTFKTWDRATGGMVGGKVSVLAGRPGMGKTAVACHLGVATAREGFATDVISLEMGGPEIGHRIVADLAYEIDEDSAPTYKNVQRGNLNNPERSVIKRAHEMLDAMPLGLIMTHNLTLAKLSGLLRRRKRYWAGKAQDLRLVVIDYLQLMQGSSGRAEHRVADLSEITRGIKNLSRELDLHIVPLSQLSRQVEQREDKRPMLSDLRESGSIEQDADNVIFAYREHYYLSQAQPKPRGNKEAVTDAYDGWLADCEACKNDLELIAAKTRSEANSRQKCSIYLNRMAIRDIDRSDGGMF